VYADHAVKAIALVGVLAAAPAFAQSNTDAEAAVRAWLDAVMSGDPAQLAAILAPEFQIQRADGTGLDKTGYVDGGGANLVDYQLRDVVATEDEDILVVRYLLVVSETISGQPVEAEAPRLTVFRRDGDRWLVVAHANFAQID
jgi:ketosteroid isomerase-like protein